MYSILHTVKVDDLDPLYRHIHHAESLKLLEKARLSLLSAVGYSAESLIERGLFPVIASIDVRYLREVTAGTFTVTCERFAVKNRSLLIFQKLVNDKGKSAVQATVTSMLFSKQTGRAVAPEPQFAKLFRNLCPDGNWSDLPNLVSAPK